MRKLSADEEADFRSIAKDWGIVGQDLEDAMGLTGYEASRTIDDTTAMRLIREILEEYDEAWTRLAPL